ncbi:uridine kinase [Pseudonocardia endophytica]|uniref:Uridine kinase n=1 Tax=Pseudonocardia endophytica TaxID=401976 RepID=A0A4R1I0P5_PSEEN|nr:uridine kinase [Pseudonocardia endophytica]TCK27461.1 hypothetical protein EV378_3332 [Pseudonocardia endophytica]
MAGTTERQGGAYRPVTPAVLAEHVVGRAAATPGRARVLLDGAPPSGADALADAVAELLRLRGRPVVVVRAADFLRPASVRLELGHTDVDMFLDGWLDDDALRREVLDPAGPEGSGRVLPRLRDPVRDRSFRDAPQDIGPDGVVVVAGARMLGRGLDAELTVHLRMSPGALGRLLPDDERWTVEAYERYDRERVPQDLAEIVVMADHPERPAMRDRDG